MRTLIVILILIVGGFLAFTRLAYGTFDPCQAAAASYRQKVETAMQAKLEGTPEGMLLTMLGPAVQPLIDAVLAETFKTRATYECVAAVPYLETPWGKERAQGDADKLIAQLKKKAS
ncbi:hypothetical protein SAMN07250955_101203 [Arboricoccus pini]|uniref:Uncharacterized protein n=1 Tax=Arboricoccus pini TaxID=1963835 RepID=A0A212PZ07_9PROT|nr:hypothetical protein [Arboricoccus pini]SNB52194.1 hypothetical protein SAMN07250955_101203 [Arboricoccus pini]